jgi:manganese-dependent inorganic pyrophosphatase
MPPETTDAPVYVIGHKHPDTDSVCSALAYAHLRQALGDTRVRAARAGDINAETRWVLQRFALPEPELLASAAGCQLILVDHNETAQALDDIRRASVLEVWEHHRIGDLDIPRPIVFHCEPVGATATLIAEQYLLNDVPFSPAMAGALLAAILSDTLVLASPTTSDKDRQMVKRLAIAAGVDPLAIGAELLAARGDLAARSVADLVEGDFKEFDFAGHRVGIAQVEAPDVSSLLARRPEALAELGRVREQRGLELVLLLVTDIGRKGSHVWSAGDHQDVVNRALGLSPDGEEAWAAGCMSRKKQVVPALEEAFAAA